MTSHFSPDDAFAVSPAADREEQPLRSSFDLIEVWAAVYRSRYWIGLIFAFALAASIVYALLATPYYNSSASIEVRQEANKVLGNDSDGESAVSRLDVERFLQTQLDIIRSRSVASAVAESLGLYSGDAFLTAMSEDVDEDNQILSAREAHRERVLEVLQDHLTVDYTGDTRIARLTFVAPDPRLAARIANGYADAFIRTSLERRASGSVYALDYIRGQLKEAQARLEESEQAALDYASEARIVDASNAAQSAESSQPRSLITAQLVQLNDTLANATSVRINAEQKWAAVSRLPLLDIPDVLSNQAIQQLVQQRAELKASYREAMANHQEDYPSVRELDAQVEEISSQITSLASSIRNSIRSDYNVAAAQENQVASKLDSLKNETLVEQNQGIQLSILRREAETNRQQYDALLRRFNTLNAESGDQTNNLTIVDRASVPDTPSWPDLPIIAGIALLMASLLSIALVVVRMQLFDSVRTPDDVTNRLGISLLGVIPTVEDMGAAQQDSKSSFSEAINSARVALVLASASIKARSLMVTSTQASEGKSNSCLAIARSFARTGKSVLLIDLDMRRPNAHRLFGVSNGVGASSLLTEEAALQEVIQHSDVTNIDFITAGPIPNNPSDLIERFTTSQFLDDLEGMYDIILVDAPPLLGLADSMLLSSRIDGTVFVIEAGRNTVRGANKALDRLVKGGGTVVGALLTKFDAGSLGYGSYSDYGYSYGYDYSSRTSGDDANPVDPLGLSAAGWPRTRSFHRPVHPGRGGNSANAERAGRRGGSQLG